MRGKASVEAERMCGMEYAHVETSGTGRGDDAERETRRTLLVLGAGPKGLAIAAKQAALKSLGFDVPRVVLVDKTGAGAGWSGKYGFTDGRRVLGTSPEKVPRAMKSIPIPRLKEVISRKPPTGPTAPAEIAIRMPSRTGAVQGPATIPEKSPVTNTPAKPLPR